MVVKTVESLKAEQIGNICLFADTAGAAQQMHAFFEHGAVSTEHIASD